MQEMQGTLMYVQIDFWATKEKCDEGKGHRVDSIKPDYFTFIEGLKYIKRSKQ